MRLLATLQPFVFHRHAALLLWTAALLATGPVAAAEVYRCGQTYQQTPCAGGQAVRVDDPRDPSQQQDAARSAAREQALAERLRSERQAREAGPGAQDDDGLTRRRASRSRADAPTPPAAPASAAPKKASLDGEDSVLHCANGTASPKTGTKRSKKDPCPPRVAHPPQPASAPARGLSR